jgi:hypothetical protein
MRTLAISAICLVLAQVSGKPMWQRGTDCFRLADECKAFQRHGVYHQPDDVWWPGRNCRHVLNHCFALQRWGDYRKFHTGPGGWMVLEIHTAAGIRRMRITPKSLHLMGYGSGDINDDGDIDLKDLAGALNTYHY